MERCQAIRKLVARESWLANLYLNRIAVDIFDNMIFSSTSVKCADLVTLAVRRLGPAFT